MQYDNVINHSDFLKTLKYHYHQNVESIKSLCVAELMNKAICVCNVRILIEKKIYILTFDAFAIRVC